MIFLVFKIGAERYALEAALVVEILPRVRLKAIPQSAVGVAGVFNYHGLAVPVVDLSAMALGEPARESLSTRLVVVRYSSSGSSGSEQLLGLLAEMATETVRYRAEDFQESGVSTPDSPYLGPVVSDARGIIQRVEVAQLLSPGVRDVLWQQAEEVKCLD